MTTVHRQPNLPSGIQANPLLAILGMALLVGGLFALLEFIAAVPVAVGLLKGLYLGTWPAFSEILATATLGGLGGLVIGLLRFWRKKSHGVVNELIATAASPDTITALRLGVIAVGFTTALGLLGGALGGALGASPSGLSPDTALALVIGGGGGLGGGGFGGAGEGELSLLTLLIAVTLLVILLTTLFSLGLGLVGFSVTKSAVLGGVAGGARGFGELAALMLTRLGTVRLTAMAHEAPPGPLATAAIIEAHLAPIADPAQRAETKAWIDEYESWIARQPVPPDLLGWDSPVDRYIPGAPRWREYQECLAHYESLPKHQRYSPEWEAQHDERVRLRQLNDRAKAEKSALELYAGTVRKMRTARDPSKRMETSDSAPTYDGTAATLFHPGSTMAALKEALYSGVYAGAVTAIIACVLIAVRG